MKALISRRYRLKEKAPITIQPAPSTKFRNAPDIAVVRIAQREEDEQAATRGEVQALGHQLAGLQETLDQRPSASELTVSTTKPFPAGP